MSIYASSFELSDEEHADGAAPIVYQRSHVLPADDDPRAGRLDLAHIPGFISRTGRPAVSDEDSDFPCHPWLRMGLESTDPNSPEPDRRYADVVLDREQVIALHEYLGQWLADAAAPPEADSCRPTRVVVDGQEEVVRVRAAEPMSEQARAALGEVVSAARRHILAANPHLGVIQELLAAARIARLCIPDGVVHTRFGERDGAQVKERLRAAAQAARAALTPPWPPAGEGTGDLERRCEE